MENVKFLKNLTPKRNHLGIIGKTAMDRAFHCKNRVTAYAPTSSVKRAKDFASMLTKKAHGTVVKENVSKMTNIAREDALRLSVLRGTNVSTGRLKTKRQKLSQNTGKTVMANV